MSELSLYLLFINILVFFQQQQIILRKHFILLNYTTMQGKKCCSVEPCYTYKVI